MTGQSTIWLRIHDFLSVTIDGSKRTNDITSLHSQYHYGLTDRRPTTSRLNWPISSITRVQYHQLTTEEVIEASVTVNNSPTQDYVHPDDHAQPTYEITPGFKPFTVYLEKLGKIIYVFFKIINYRRERSGVLLKSFYFEFIIIFITAIIVTVVICSGISPYFLADTVLQPLEPVGGLFQEWQITITVAATRQWIHSYR